MEKGEIDIDKIKEFLSKGENTDSVGNFYDGDLYTRRAKGSSAVGKYQFVESVWGNKIKDFALQNGYKYDGIDDFINNSVLQEDFTDSYITNDLLPQVKSLKNNFDTSNIKEEQLIAALHYSGYGNLRKAIESRDFDSNINHISPNEYLKRAGLDKVTFGQPVETNTNDFNYIQPPEQIYAKVDNTYVEPPIRNNVTEKRVPLVLQQQKSQNTEFGDKLLQDVLNFKSISGVTQYENGGLKKIPLTLKTDISINGYKDSSPYKNERYLNIFSDSGKITMDNVSVPLLVQSNMGEQKILKPNSGVHHFKGTEFKETPIFKNGGNKIRLMLRDDGECTECTKKFQDGGDDYSFLYTDERLNSPVTQATAKKWHILGGRKCTGGVCVATDNIMPILGEKGLTQWKETHNFPSGETHSRFKDYGESVDAWDLQGAIIEANGKNWYNSKTDGELSSDDFDSIVTKLPIGTVLNYGDASHKSDVRFNDKMGLGAGNHSTIIIGRDTTGYPVVYDLGTVTRAKLNSYGNITSISTPKEYLKYDYNYLKDNGLLNDVIKYDDEINKLEIGLNKIGQQDNERLNKFVTTLSEEKHDLYSLIGVRNNKEYDDLSKLAVALSMVETKGGATSIGTIADRMGLGSSLGATQINHNNIWKKDDDGNYIDPILVEKFKKAGIKDKSDLFDIEKSAKATLILLSTFKNRSNSAYKEGIKPNYRYYRNADTFAGFMRDVDEVYIPDLKKTVSTPNDPVSLKILQNKLKNNNSKYEAGKDEKGYYIRFKTQGNSSELSDLDKLIYYWNSPYTLKSGDAQGDSEYFNKVKNYYNKLEN